MSSWPAVTEVPCRASPTPSLPCRRAAAELAGEEAAEQTRKEGKTAKNRRKVQAKKAERAGKGDLANRVNAAKDGDVNEVKRLLEHGANVLKADDEGVTPLLIASCCNGHLEVVKLLITHGGDVNRASSDGSTPIFTPMLAGQWQ